MSETKLTLRQQVDTLTKEVESLKSQLSNVCQYLSKKYQEEADSRKFPVVREAFYDNYDSLGQCWLENPPNIHEYKADPEIEKLKEQLRILQAQNDKDSDYLYHLPRAARRRTP